MNYKIVSMVFSVLIACNLPMHTHDSKQKVVLITGASQGIGLVIAKKLALNGYHVYGTIRTTSDIRQLQQAVHECSGNLTPVVLDVTDEQSITHAMQKIIAEAGTIDVLINNACTVFVGTCETCTLEEQQRTMDVNYFGVVRMLQAVLPHMRKQQHGHVINISSVSGFESFPIIETYAASKFALEGLSASLATYLHNWNIKVTLIEPAGVQTNVAFTSPQGSQWNDGTYCFKAFCEAGHQGMKDSFDHCQDPEEIAALIVTILKDQNPSLRYQTNAISREMAQQVFKDSTGQNALLAKREKLKPMLALMK